MITIQYKMNGITESVQMEKGENLLDGLLNKGIKVDFSCCVGSCARCRATLISGDLLYDPDDMYSLCDSEKEKGVILTCQCLTSGDCALDLYTK
jgi:ferredoxin